MDDSGLHQPRSNLLSRSLAFISDSRSLRLGAWGFSDQALISLTNMATMVFVARGMTPSAFGVFTLSYTVLLFANSVQSAIITQPHNVLGASLSYQEFRVYTTATGLMQLGLILTFLVPACIAALAAQIAHWHLVPLFLALSCAIVAWQAQEYVRRVMYTNGRVTEAVFNDLIAYGGQLVCVGVLWKARLLSEVVAVMVIAVTSAIAAVIGGWQLRHAFTMRIRKSSTLRYCRQNLHFGKWLLGSTLGSWTSGQLYPVFTAGFIGVAATGAIRAAQTSMGPPQVLLKAIDTSFTPRATVIYRHEGVDGLHSFIWRIFIITGPVVLAYCVLVSSFSQFIVTSVFGPQYARYGWLLIPLAVTTFISYGNVLTFMSLRAMEVTAPVFRAYMYATMLVLTLGVVAVYTFGLIAAAVGLIIHPLLIFIVLYRQLYLSSSIMKRHVSISYSSPDAIK